VGRGAEVDKARGETPVKLVRAKRGQATDPHSVAERVSFVLGAVCVMSEAQVLLCEGGPVEHVT
jgi:hypothetical protein